ncbi:MAG: DUF4968 domain-containing protein, partial [Bacteroidales bacterium]|nr:DUF4968 domain-containing protein [Bacteroidales bacterium]
MKRIQMFLMAMLMAIAATAAGPVKFQAGQSVIYVEFYSDEIVRVSKFPVGKEIATQSLVVTAKPQDVKLTTKPNSVQSAKLTVKFNPQTFALSFYDAKGKLLLAEKSYTFEDRPGAVERNTYKLTQSFLLKKDEQIYGLGTIQDGKLSRRDAHILMEQSNLQDFQNV